MAQVSASDVHEGSFLLLDGRPYKVVGRDLRGTAKLSRVIHFKLKDPSTGRQTERTWRAGETVEQATLERHTLSYVYRDADTFYFMDEQTFEQEAIPAETVGPAAPFLKENTSIQILYHEEKPVSIDLPRLVPLKVVSAPPGIREMDQSTMKTVTLENGTELLVPQFIREGDVIEVEVETGKYVDRVKK